VANPSARVPRSSGASAPLAHHLARFGETYRAASRSKVGPVAIGPRGASRGVEAIVAVAGVARSRSARRAIVPTAPVPRSLAAREAIPHAQLGLGGAMAQRRGRLRLLRSSSRAATAPRFYGSQGRIMVIDVWPDEQGFGSFLRRTARRLKGWFGCRRPRVSRESTSGGSSAPATSPA